MEQNWKLLDMQLSVIICFSVTIHEADDTDIVDSKFTQTCETVLKGDVKRTSAINLGFDIVPKL